MTLCITPSATNPDIDSLVRDLRQLCHAHGLAMTIGIGKLIVERLYAGESYRWQSHGRKDMSFRKLESHPNLPFHASTLSRAVAIFLLSQRRPDLLLSGRLGPSHLQEVLGLDEETQDKLIARADSERWSVQRVRAEAHALRSHQSSHGGRPRLPAFRKCLSRIHPHLNDRTLLNDLDAIDRLDADETQQLLNVTKQLCYQAELLARQLTSHLSRLGPSTAKPAKLSRPEPAILSRPEGMLAAANAR